MQLTERIKAKARDIGFGKVAITNAAQFSDDTRKYYRNWLKQGFHGDLEYLELNMEKRMAPEKVLKGARSIISVALNYNPGDPGHPAGRMSGRIARYALGADYHRVVPEKLSELLGFVKEETNGDVRGSMYCDTGPLMEKAIAERAGLGWIGKHGVLVTQEFGSWIFLGEILIDLPLCYDEPATNLCSSCTLCMESCPTGAIVSPGVVDISRCISYLTVENRQEIPEALRSALGNWIFGCDICQEVCPYNGNVPVTQEISFLPRPELVSAPLDMLFAVSVERFDESFADSSIARARQEGFLRNIVVAMGNSGQRSFIPLLRTTRSNPNAVLKEHAKWAMAKIAGSKEQGTRR
jgi:epoxyqueuosine reductase